MNVVVYRQHTGRPRFHQKKFGVGNLHFEDVVKIDRVRNNDMFHLNGKNQILRIAKTKAKSFEVYRYFVKVEDHFYIIYAWQENMQALNSTNEKELFAMVNSIEAN